MALTSRRRLFPVTCLALIILPVAILTLRAVKRMQDYHQQPLFAAIRRNDTATVIALLNAGADPNARDPGTARGLSKADHFFAAINHDNRRENGQTPLLAALYRTRTIGSQKQCEIIANPNPNVAILRALLDKGAKVDATDDTAETQPIIFAVVSSNTQAVGLLLQHGAKINGSSTEGIPLIFAAGQGRTEMMRFLLARGADTNARNLFGATALIATVRYARLPDAVQILLDANANVNCKDKRGNTALAYARTPLPTDSSQTRHLPRVIAMLKNAGAK